MFCQDLQNVPNVNKDSNHQKTSNKLVSLIEPLVYKKVENNEETRSDQQNETEDTMWNHTLKSFILQNFEEAISSNNSDEVQDLMNIAIVGAGPTGVELAGALGEMKKYVFPKDYPELDLSRMRIMLFEAAPRVLAAMSEEASAKAEKYVKQFDVEIYLNTLVSEYDDSELKTKDGQSFRTDTIIWTAGISSAE